MAKPGTLKPVSAHDESLSSESSSARLVIPLRAPCVEFKLFVSPESIVVVNALSSGRCPPSLTVAATCEPQMVR